MGQKKIIPPAIPKGWRTIVLIFIVALFITALVTGLTATLISTLNSKTIVNFEASLEILTKLAALIAIPWISYRFLTDLADRKRKRDAEVYAVVDAALRDSLRLTIEYPELAVGAYEYSKGAVISEDDVKSGAQGPSLEDIAQMRQSLLYEHITATFEICFLSYHALHDDKTMRQSWKAWRRYIGTYCTKPSYRTWLQQTRIVGSDKESKPPSDEQILGPLFQEEMRSIYKEVTKEITEKNKQPRFMWPSQKGFPALDAINSASAANPSKSSPSLSPSPTRRSACPGSGSPASARLRPLPRVRRRPRP